MACDLSAEPKAGYRPCVGIMLIDARDRVFVGQRCDTRAPAWQMPQGGIDPGEKIVAAGLRELHEEIGTASAVLLCESRWWRSYDLPTDIARRLWHGRYRGQTQKWLAFRFTGADRDIEINGTHPEFCAWCWLPPDELVRSIVPFKREIYLSVVEEFRHLWA